MARYKDRRAKDILDLGNHLFTKRGPKDSLDQEIAWQFCPDLAEFTSPLQLGEDWAADRMDSFPEMVSRELVNQVGANLRPEGTPWFKQSTGDDELDADEAVAQFNEYITRTVRRELYRPNTGFVGATTEADRFYVNFGQAVISCEEAPGTRDHLFFRNYHIKDCVWLDNQLGNVDHLHRKSKMSARAMKRMFREDRLHESILRAAQKEPNREFEVRFITMPTDEYEDFTADEASKSDRSGGRRLPFVVCAIDVENCRVIKDGGLVAFNYIVPRWMRLTSTQYAFSPATMTALADGRMAQMLSQILLESGEKAIDPPMVGKQDVVIGEPNIAAGGISWVDVDHEAKLTDALDVLKIDADMRVGFQMRLDLREMLTKAFFIDKLALPESTKEMTAFETARRIEEHVRNLLPIFTPIQVEYNARILDTAFEFLRNMKKIDFSRMPEQLSNVDTSWQFQTPLQEAQSRILVEQFLESCNVLAVGQQAGATSIPIHVDKALRDAIRGVGGPAIWRKTQEEQDEEAEANAQTTEVQNTIQQIAGGAAAAEQVGNAGQALGLIAPPAPGMAVTGGGGEAAAPSAPPASGAAAASGGAPAGGGLPAGIDLGAMLSGLGGGEMAPGGAATATPADNVELQELRRMMRMLMRKIDTLEAAIKEPKKISISRNKDGKITGASAEAR